MVVVLWVVKQCERVEKGQVVGQRLRVWSGGWNSSWQGGWRRCVCRCGQEDRVGGCLVVVIGGYGRE